MLEVLRYIALNALNTVQKIKAMSKMSKIDKVHIRGVRLCMSKMSKMGKEHTHTFWLITSLILNGFSIRKMFWKAETESFPTLPSNPMYVEACRRCRRWEKNIQKHFYHTFLNMVSFECNPMYVEDVEDRSNTPKAVMLSMSKMSKIDQIHLRAVMLCMSKMSKMGKEHTHTFWLITSLILNGFSIRKKFWKAETESFPTIPSNPMYVKACRRCRRWEKNIQTHFYHTFLNIVSFECNPMYVEDVEDRSNTPKGCNAMYVEDVKDVEDGKRTYTHIFDIFDMLQHT